MAHTFMDEAFFPSWLAKADIGIQSSIWEGFGLTAVEMMVAGFLGSVILEVIVGITGQRKMIKRRKSNGDIRNTANEQLAEIDGQDD